ncbi:FRAS1- extracellular matrix protein 2 [Bulinus truncatus]|nr:FRAS1- extracellular matrix protein 2 [Bulinus truncatus]
MYSYLVRSFVLLPSTPLVGNLLVGQQTFHLNWAWISLDNDTYLVNETDILNVTLRRRGYLGEMASVNVHVINGTARSGEDFSSSYVRQVQFSPAQGAHHYKAQCAQHYKAQCAQHYKAQGAHHYKAQGAQQYKAQCAQHYKAQGAQHYKAQCAQHYKAQCAHHYKAQCAHHYKTQCAHSYRAQCAHSYESTVGSFPEVFIIIVAVPKKGLIHGIDTSHRANIFAGDGYSLITSVIGELSIFGLWLRMPEDNPVQNILVESEETLFGQLQQLCCHNISFWNGPRLVVATVVPGNIENWVRLGQTEKIWKLRLLDDMLFEKFESFELRLADPVSAVLDQPDAAQVTIQDFEDESHIFFTDRVLRTSEKIGDILIPIKRVGDSSEEVTVICSTVSGTAVGTFPVTVTSSDFVPRPTDHTGVVTINRGEKESHCRVTIIDDALNEEEEKFSVQLTEPSGGQLGKITSVDIYIEPDQDDVPVFYFANSEFSVDESDQFVEIPVVRSGSDLSKTSNVTVKSKKSDPKTADAGQDYIAMNNVLEFGPGETTQTVRVTILDDASKPRLEGPESFLVQLRSPMNGHLGEPHTAVVTMTDVESDLPSVQFKEAKYNFRESNGKVEVVIYRTGDVNHESAVLCHSKAGTAKPGADYADKPATVESLIVFSAGEHDKMCAVTLVDDALYEENKHFSLHLTPAVANKLYSVKIGPQGSTTVTIHDEDDHPVIKLSDTKYVVREPMFKEETSRLQIPVIRLGDLSQTIIVTLDTADDTALAGSDYTPIFTELVFGSNESKKNVEVEILYDGVRETRETFTVQLRSRSGIVRIENAAATVHIEERNRVSDISFPDIPVVMSLRDFDRPDAVDDKPIQGYPLICVTPCNPKHPSHENSRPLCDSQNIDDSLTLYRWRASSLTRSGGVTEEMYDVQSNTFFTSTKSITLDSIYFAGGSRVQCVVRAVSSAGDPGHEQESEIKTINPESGVCEPRAMDSITAEPFTARIQYTG